MLIVFALASNSDSGMAVTVENDAKAFDSLCQNLVNVTGLQVDTCGGDPCGEGVRSTYVPSCLTTATGTKAVQLIEIIGKEYYGNMSESFGNFSHLEELKITITSMNGTVPSSFVSLKKMEIVGNKFTGELPRLYKSTALETLDLSWNFFNGSISNETFPPSCYSLNVSNNHITGELPNLFQYFAGDLSTPIRLNVSNNNLTGSIPQTVLDILRRFPKSKLDISFNNFTGYIPQDLAKRIRSEGNPNLCNSKDCQDQGRKNEGGLSRGLLIALVILSIFVFVTILSITFLARAYSMRKLKTKRSLSLKDGPLEFTHEELATATGGFYFGNMLGRGGFGHVYKGVLEDGNEIAVKVLNRSDAHGQGEQEYEAEVNIIGQIHHRNLVRLYGFCKEQDNRILVYEYLSKGSLAFQLHEAKTKLSWSQRCNIFVGAARGLAYLHEDCTPRIVHRDIKPSNILLTDNFEAKLADFGLAKLIPEGVTTVTTKVLGTWGYVAPEIISAERVGEQADVFSFGMVVLEILSGRAPSGETDILDLAKRCESEGNYSNLLEPDLEKECDMEQVSKIAAMALTCLAYDPMMRPSMGNVVRMLEEACDTNDSFVSSVSIAST